jgi:hypothetical protein
VRGVAVTLTQVTQVTGSPAAPRVCAAGRGVWRDEWPGWRRPCGEPRILGPLCYWHAWDLAERNEGQEEGQGCGA